MNVVSINPHDEYRNYDSKECIHRMELITFTDKGFKVLARVRMFMGRSSSSTMVYCSAYFNTADKYENSACGYGTAGGGGYCKQSSAFYEASKRAGIKFDEEISGRGMSAVEEALTALARHLGYDNSYVARG